ncbi:hypothetical protein AKJ09_04580 [Labilithrix luteola]|uniref:Uncharacterized protein n=1 Tax=Labilithrix luteola TaxID=1391654 RepID=A0A0K1PX11_9BACT|nr:hypothetical protein AKJ09_04580 [Labilithrix luteola]
MNFKRAYRSSLPLSGAKVSSTTSEPLSYAVADSDVSKVPTARSAIGVCAILLGELLDRERSAKKPSRGCQK